MKKKRERRIAMLLAIMMLVMNLIVSPVWAGPGDITINATNFPDNNFRNYVSTKLDTNSDGKLSDTEITNATSIKVSGENIADLKGIEYFTALQTLDCSYNQLTNLGVSNNPALKVLDCSNNQLTNLDVSNKSALQKLDCQWNQLTSLDISNNPALEYIDCNHNTLKNLDLSSNPKLQKLHCYDNELTNLDVSKNPALEYLTCFGNGLTNLDVSNNPALELFRCDDNQLTNLDVSNNPALKKLYCQTNKLTKLDVSNSPALVSLSCEGNQLTSLDLSNNPALQGLNCSNNQLKNLDVSNNPALQGLVCSDNLLKNLDLSNNPALQGLDCNSNQLTNLDLSKNTALVNFDCNSNQLTNLDVSKNPALKYLYCFSNRLTKLDVSNNPALELFRCDYNQLTNLDVSNNPALQMLYCNTNKLTKLDVSNNTALKELYCNTNKLTKLDVSKNKALEQLYFSENQLTSLNLANNTNIIFFSGSDQTYDVKVNRNDLKINYADFPGTFDITKVTDIVGADSSFIVDASKPSTVTYNYNPGIISNDDPYLKRVRIKVTLNITYGYTVTFNTNGGSAVSPQTITAGEHVTKPADPTKDGYTFDGWYKDAGLTETFDFATETINADTTIYAKWTQNAQASYTLTVNVEGGHGSVTPASATVEKGKTLEVTFKPETNYEIDTVNLDGTDVKSQVASNKLTVTMDKSKTLTVKFKLKSVIPEQAVLTVNVEGGHGSVTPASTTVEKGKPVEVTFKPETNYEIDTVTLDGTDVKSQVASNKLTVTMDKSKTLTVKFKLKSVIPEQAVLTVNVEGGHGSVTPASATVEKGKPVEVTFKPETNYEIDTVTLDGADVKSQVASNKLTVTMDKSKTLTVKFKLKSVIPEQAVLTVNVEGGHGSVTPASATVEKGKPVEITFKPETNYEIDTVTLDGTDVKSQVASNKLTVTMDKSKTLTVKFKLKSVIPEQAVLTVNVEGGHGSVTPTSKTVNKNETVTLTFTPETGYEIEEVKVNDVVTPVSGNTLTLTMDGDKTVVVKYKATPTPPIGTPVTITFDKNGGTGTMADVTKNKGESFTLPACTFTPPVGKEFKAWQVDGTEKNVGDNIVLNGDKIIKAVWKDIGSVPPTPPVPPTPYIPYPWIVYPGWYYNIEAPKPKEEKPVTKMEIDWKLELIVGVSTINREINGVQSKIKMDIAPYIRDGRTMLPIRYVAEALGFDVEWIRSTRTVVLKNTSTRVEIPVDTNQIIVNGTVYTSDVKPEIKNNRTMLPIANIARALGLKDGKDIIWDSKSKMVTIYSSIVVK